MEEVLFPIGRVVKLHGVKGKIKVDYFGDDAGQFQLYRKVFIRDVTGRPRPYEVLEATPQPPRFIVRLKDVENPEEAGTLVGKEILIEKGSLKDLPEGEYYWFEILGMEVVTEGGNRLGRVKEIVPTGANDVYVIQGKKREISLPAVEGVIRRIDRDGRVITVAWMEGLWEREDEV